MKKQTFIAIASGKGGTGKTTVATNLATVASRNGALVAYLDCDVEEPNGHIFLKPAFTASREVGILRPEVDADKCTLCGACERICQYSAIVCFPDRVQVYPELCHACGGCFLVCPEGAITEVPREIGKIEIGRAGAMDFVRGVLNVGQPMSPPVIREVRKAAPSGAELVILDSPPGTSCPVIESIRGVDFVLLVTEPTPFGLHDLKLAVEMVKALRLPCGVAINRSGLGDREVLRFCDQNGVPVLAQIPEDRKIAEIASRGNLILDAIPQYRKFFGEMLEAILDEIAEEGRGKARRSIG